MNNFLEASEQIGNKIIEDRRYLHRHPEIGFNLQQTSTYVQEKLDEIGIEWNRCGGPLDEETRKNFVFAGFPDMAESTGIVATIGNGQPCILLRADMDALPMAETPGNVEFMSENQGLGHMCGHDCHTAMLLGAARILKNMENQLQGTVKLMFQTGEECGCGSKFMVEHGVMENPKVDAAFAMHIMSDQKFGTIKYSSGIASAAMDTYMVKIKGKGGHSSMPQLTVDPLMIANQIYTTLNLLACREVDPRETVALTVGKCGGGTTSNIIPDTAELMVGIRTFNRDVREHMNKRVPEIVEHTVRMWQGEYDLIDFHTPSTYTNEDLCKEMEPFIAEIVGQDNIEIAPCMAGTEDFGYVTEQAPGMFIWLGAGEPGKPSVHNPNMVIDENSLPIGSALFANCAVKWLKNNQK